MYVLVPLYQLIYFSMEIHWFVSKDRHLTFYPEICQHIISACVLCVLIIFIERKYFLQATENATPGTHPIFILSDQCFSVINTLPPALGITVSIRCIFVGWCMYSTSIVAPYLSAHTLHPSNGGGGLILYLHSTYNYIFCRYIGKLDSSTRDVRQYLGIFTFPV